MSKLERSVFLIFICFINRVKLYREEQHLLLNAAHEKAMKSLSETQETARYRHTLLNNLKQKHHIHYFYTDIDMQT